MSHIHCTTMANLVKSLTTGGTANEIAERVAAYRERQRLKREIEIKLERVRGMV